MSYCCPFFQQLLSFYLYTLFAVLLIYWEKKAFILLSRGTLLAVFLSKRCYFC